jgi:hypothetical protein
MKKIFLLLFVFSLLGCEKDDICDANTPTTPRLVIEFYDFNASTETLKNVTKLKVKSDDVAEGIVFNESITDANRYLSNSSKIFIPLKTTDVTTKYNFTHNFGVAGSENTDILEFKYTKQDFYISRACGFKTLFTLNPTNPIVTTEPFNSPSSWIKNIVIVKANLENENEVHVKIFF